MIYLFLFAVIVATGIYFSRSANRMSDKNGADPVQTQSNVAGVTAKTGSFPQANIIYLTKGTNASSIFTYDLINKISKKIFTDSDEALKIKQVSGTANDGKHVLATLAGQNQEFGGSLYLIATDGTGTKNKLIDNFASPVGAVISPDGKKIAYTVFSNVETEYGFSLFAADADGNNATIVYRDPENITNYVFSPDGRHITFIKGGISSATRLMSVKIDGTGAEEIYQTKDIAYSLDWNDGEFVFILGPKGQAEEPNTEIYRLKTGQKNPEQLTRTEGKEKTLKLFPDGNWISYIVDNQLYVMSMDNRISTNLEQNADQVIGWVEK